MLRSSAYYTEEEICYLYKHAKNKRTEIRILMELTGADRETIIEILLTNGLIETHKAICIRCGHDFDQIFNYRKCSKCEREIEDLRMQINSIQNMKKVCDAKNKLRMARLDAEAELLRKKLKGEKT